MDHYDQQLHINNVHNLKSSKGVLIVINYQNLEKIVSTGSSAIENEGVLSGQALEISMSGAGSVKIDMDVENLILNLSGAGLVDLQGFAARQDITISGAGGYNATNLETNTCSITLSGVGGAKVFVTDLLEATITGVGGIAYTGDPKKIKKQITGFGKIERLDADLEHHDH